jgi:hypothetical protein
MMSAPLSSFSQAPVTGGMAAAPPPSSANMPNCLLDPYFLSNRLTILILVGDVNREPLAVDRHGAECGHDIDFIFLFHQIPSVVATLFLHDFWVQKAAYFSCGRPNAPSKPY